jgi:hypothetical protein
MLLLESTGEYTKALTLIATISSHSARSRSSHSPWRQRPAQVTWDVARYLPVRLRRTGPILSPEQNSMNAAAEIFLKDSGISCDCLDNMRHQVCHRAAAVRNAAFPVGETAITSPCSKNAY